MADNLKLNSPWLVAVWPGMGNVALSAGYYLLAKLEMHVIAEYEARELFDVEQIEVKEGIIQGGRLPRNRFFVWMDPDKKRDIVVFLGEAQPPLGKYQFCHKLLSYAEELGVQRIFTFAAMATPMHPKQPSRVFGAATDQESLDELKRLEVTVLEDGHIAGLNGVLLGAAAEKGWRGACLLGEMPHLFRNFPFPKGSQAILEIFSTITGIDLDFTELAEQAQIMEQQLGDLLSQVEKTYGTEEEAGYSPEAAEEEQVTSADIQRIERLFEQVKKDRSKAFELKRELDRLGLFKEYEDRFLDLFKQAE
jgi:proteasome assembly chaperone (PAC2) family protein